MERMLVVVFDTEAEAYEGSGALQSLAEDSMIAVYAIRVVTKDGSAAITVTNSYDSLPQGTMGGTAVGTLIGMLGGPAGLAVGAASGFVIGATTDLVRARVGDDFIADVANALVPGKAALVAEIDEDFTDSVDARMKALGGFVFRRDLSDVADMEFEEEIAAIKADIARTKAELAASRIERKGRLHARIESLNEKLHRTLDHAKARRKEGATP